MSRGEARQKGGYNGILLVNKEAGYTSSDVVAKLRGILRQRRIGHTGTLDPQAVGLLVVCVGAATRVAEMLTAHEKEYIAGVQLGLVTDTQDLTGEVIERRGFDGIDHKTLMDAVMAFKGGYEQIPPMYSAIKVGGKRLYAMAREGKVIDRAPRRVEIPSISVLDDSGLAERGFFSMDVRCSKGTYIRALCHDIGERLGCGAAMASLVRTRVGGFSLEDALTLSQIEAMRDEGALDGVILPLEGIFKDLERIDVETDHLRQMENGNPVGLDLVAGGAAEEDFKDGQQVRVYCDGSWFGVYRYSRPQRLFRVEKFFYTPK